jgi:hypothetical protein
MNRRVFSTVLLAGAAAPLVSEAAGGAVAVDPASRNLPSPGPPRDPRRNRSVSFFVLAQSHASVVVSWIKLRVVHTPGSVLQHTIDLPDAGSRKP